MSSVSDWRVSVGGSKDGGWIVDIHDGVRNEVYSPTADDADQAFAAATGAHRDRFHAPPAPVPAPVTPVA